MNQILISITDDDSEHATVRHRSKFSPSCKPKSIQEDSNLIINRRRTSNHKSLLDHDITSHDEIVSLSEDDFNNLSEVEFNNSLVAEVIENNEPNVDKPNYAAKMHEDLIPFETSKSSSIDSRATTKPWASKSSQMKKPQLKSNVKSSSYNKENPRQLSKGNPNQKQIKPTQVKSFNFKMKKDDNNEKDKELYDIRRQNAIASNHVMKKEAQKKRESIQLRRMNAKKNAKKVDQSMSSQDGSLKSNNNSSFLFSFNSNNDQDIYQQRYEDWKDIQKKSLEDKKSKRESLSRRLLKWKEEKRLDQLNKAKAWEQSHIEYEMHQHEKMDLYQYELLQQRRRRESLQFRLKEYYKEKDYEKGLKALKDEVVQHEKGLKDEDREMIGAVEATEKKIRRQSLLFRHQVENAGRVYEEGVEQEQDEEDRKYFESQSIEWRELQQRKEELNKERRKSLANRLVVSIQQKEKEMTDHAVQLEKVHQDLELRRLDWIAMKEAKELEKERNRKSLAMRLDNWRHQRYVEMMIENKKAAIAEQEAIWKELDHQAFLEAKAIIQSQQPFVDHH